MRYYVQFYKSKTNTKNISLLRYPKDERQAIWVKHCNTEIWPKNFL